MEIFPPGPHDDVQMLMVEVVIPPACYCRKRLECQGHGIIISTMGLRLGILSQDMFSTIVLVAVVLSLITPSVLKCVLRRISVRVALLKILSH